MEDFRHRLAADWPLWRDRLIKLPRFQKRALLVVHDYLLMGFALWLALSARWSTIYVPETAALGLVLAVAPAIAVATFGWFGLYRLVTRYIGPHGTGRIIACIALSVLIWSLLILLTGVGLGGPMGIVPRSVPIIYFVFACAFIMGSRSIAALILRDVEIKLKRERSQRKAVLIYGAGSTGVQLLESLARTGEARVAGFIDQNPNLWGQYVGGIKVYKPEKIARLMEREDARELILAMPELKRREQQVVLRDLQQYAISVKLLPSMADLASGRITVSDLRAVQVEDLLGRDPVPPNRDLLARGIKGKSVMVTGAGGSIGAELVRQIVQQGPSQLVLFDNAEPALYEIETEITDGFAALAPGAPRPAVHGVLGSVLDRKLVAGTIERFGIQTIYHAAAYKHVPIVEANPVAGLANNTFGTGVVAAVAREVGVERFVLISTDKAVRPTNVMGASKRLAELILQTHAADPGCETVFTIVRFGNVLDSSGSVVRRFRQQIHAGGPITVTHPDVTRYFMSIPEAAELVLQAGAMASGGEVYVLEMGEPVKIDALARAMVRLVGLDVKDADNPDGEIAIVYSGLRPGEKLYEELLLGESTTATEHPRIMHHNEPRMTSEELRAHLEVLKAAMEEQNAEAIHAVLMRAVEGYAPDLSGLGEARRAQAQVSTLSRTLH